MKFNIFHHDTEAAPVKKEPEFVAQDEASQLKPGATSVVTRKNKTADSDEIIAKVDAAYKEFTAFQTNLKLLLRHYKDEHAAIKNMNEKRFETAKTLDLMFTFSPLASAVSHGSPSAPAPREFFRDSLLNIVGQEEVSTRDSSGGNDPSTRDSSGGNNPFDEEKPPESEEEVNYKPRERKGSAVDAPEIEEEQSISLQTIDHSPAEPQVDPPADVEIPDNYPKDDGPWESIGDSVARDSSGLNVIADEDEEDAPTDEDNASKPHSKSIDPVVVEEPSGDKAVAVSLHEFCDKRTDSDRIHDPTGEKEELPPSESHTESDGPDSKVNIEPTGEKITSRIESISFTESKGPLPKSETDTKKALDKLGAAEDDAATKEMGAKIEEEHDPNIVAESENEEEKEDQHNASATPGVSPEKDYFNNVTPHALWSGTTKQSYYDVQELAYNECNKYIEQHENLVKYVEDWERILFQRVHGLYTEYMKQRKNLQHYIKKMGQLKKEMAKLEKQAEEKEKPINPKKVEKLNRNEVKLSGAREAHGNSGETLYLFLDEVVHRAWRDVYPLLQRTVKFDQDFSAVQAKIFLRLNGTAELLDLIGKNKAISISSRLKSLQTLHPEVIYSGHDAKTV